MELTSTLTIGFIASFFLLAVLSLTAFVKISVVLMIVRNALGLQQVPSNGPLMTIALFISLFISLPVFTLSLEALRQIEFDPETVDDFIEIWYIGIAPFQAFMADNIDQSQITFFVDISNELWRDSNLQATEDSFIAQVPSFLLTELTEAFEIGFLLYLPFIAIDLAVTGILMSLGMQQVQPNIIAVPFKLLVFVMVDGWTKLIEGLITTYIGSGG